MIYTTEILRQIKVFWLLALATVSLIAIMGCSVQAGQGKFSPDLPWRVHESAHFRLHYHPQQWRLALRFEHSLEEAYKYLSQDLHLELEHKIDVLLNSASDDFDGHAEVFPNDKVVLNTVPFFSHSTLGEYDDWLQTLAIHELTHILSSDNSRGLFRVLRGVFGSAAKPNAYLPLWMIEGLAVYQETQATLYGRGRSVHLDQVLRSAVVEKMFNNPDPELGLDLSRFNNGAPHWPAESTPYLLGYVLHQWLARYASPGRLPHYAAARFPFWVDQISERLTEKTFGEIWQETRTAIEAYVEKDLSQIRQMPVTSTQSLAPENHHGRWSGGLVASADEKSLYFIRDSYRSGEGLSQFDLETGKMTDLSDWRWKGRKQLRRSGDYLLYSQIRPFDQFKSFSDLYVFDLKQKKEIRLSRGFRAMDGDFSPEFSAAFIQSLVEKKPIPAGSGRIVYIKTLEDGNQGLYLWDGREEKTLYRTYEYERLSGSAWGRGKAKDWIALSRKKNGGSEQLIAVHVESGTVKEITALTSVQERVNERQPFWTEDGQLYYAASYGGIFNLYLLKNPIQDSLALKTDPGWKLSQRLTHLESGAQFPVLTSQGLFAFVYHRNGYRLSQVDATHEHQDFVSLLPVKDKLQQTLASPEASSSPSPSPVPSSDSTSSAPVRFDKPAIASAYRIFPALWPNYWLPHFALVPDGLELGGRTHSHDALKLHTLNLFAAWDNRANFPLFEVSYRYEGWYPTILLSHAQENRYIGAALRSSNRFTLTDVLFVYPFGDYQLHFGGTLSGSRFQGVRTSDGGLQARIVKNSFRANPDSLLPRGHQGWRSDVTVLGFLTGSQRYLQVEEEFEFRLPTFEQQFLRFTFNFGKSYNPALPPIPFVGGGQSVLSARQSYMLRGYDVGALFGREMMTSSLEYWFSLAEIFRGYGTLPFTSERFKAHFFIDTGSAEFVSGRRSSQQHWPIGIGANLLMDLKLLFHFPWTAGLGFHWGLDSRYLGEKQVVFGFHSTGF